VGDGEVVGMLGQNGSGKSTLAKAVCGMVPFFVGEILFNGKSITGLPTNEIARLGVGFFQQGGKIFPNLTTQENLFFALGGLNSKEKQQRINEVGAWFEILRRSDRSKLKASYLSGGEKHQLALAMIIVQNPKFLILDEPSAGLSPGNANEVYNILFEMSKNRHFNCLLIEQNPTFAANFSQRLISIREGIISENIYKNN
jgi:ABC-type branched-subunit amino acid transport system ATPase component